MNAPDYRAARRSRGVLFVVLSTLLAGVVGLTLGAVVGGVLYEPLGPPWAQFGVDPEGVDWMLKGALWGGAVSALLAGLVSVAVRHDPRGRRRMGAVLGGAFGGTAGGLGTFPATAPRWVGPVALVTVVGAVMGALAGARWRSAGARVAVDAIC